MRNRAMRTSNDRWWKISLVIGLLAIAAGCEKSTSSTAKSNRTAGTAAAVVHSLGPAPTVSFQNLNGQTVNLAQYHGKVVLVNFWATWCEPCKSEIPELIQLQDKFGNRNFTVLGIAMDQEGKSVVAPFVAKPQFQVGEKKVAMDYPIVLGNSNVETKFGGLLGLPTSYLISQNGQIVKKVIGMIDAQSMGNLIQKLLSGSVQVSSLRPAATAGRSHLG